MGTELIMVMDTINSLIIKMDVLFKVLVPQQKKKCILVAQDVHTQLTKNFMIIMVNSTTQINGYLRPWTEQQPILRMVTRTSRSTLSLVENNVLRKEPPI